MERSYGFNLLQLCKAFVMFYKAEDENSQWTNNCLTDLTLGIAIYTSLFLMHTNSLFP
ncbi:unnamed protein product [Sphenostylis stenocarpa]|uniref:Uncharacterized protein n=1 Tax=Sphenostylis stenocarpa TaxID=92480 RepID=A0AA86SEP5_9FABA|nr:unnamed protein product [Sphenostylis stenocarpa]